MRRAFALGFGLLLADQGVAEISAESIALNCRTCHSQNAPEAKLRSIEQLSAADINRLLLDFKYDRQTATLMPRIAKAYSDAELATVAAYLGRH